MPIAPPNWRVVSFTADPTPARDRGSEPMIESVHGAITLPIPIPITHVMRITCSALDETVSVLSNAYDDATISRPAATTRLLPNRRTHVLLKGAEIMIVAA